MVKKTSKRLPFSHLGVWCYVQVGLTNMCTYRMRKNRPFRFSGKNVRLNN